VHRAPLYAVLRSMHPPPGGEGPHRDHPTQEHAPPDGGCGMAYLGTSPLSVSATENRSPGKAPPELCVSPQGERCQLRGLVRSIAQPGTTRPACPPFPTREGGQGVRSSLPARSPSP